mmetsp:Transcript_580/g.1189  ORF Transcript_580/g.1189 Transcript_580/m.1189 type:complete len:281 (-) Transcript_580:447-1289(-)
MFNLYPFPWVLACVDEFSFGAALFGNDVVFPSRGLRKTHQDTFNSSTSLEAEDSSPIVNQVELNISSTTHELPFLFLLCEFVVLVLSDDRSVGLDDGVQAFLGEFKVLIGCLVVLIVEEDSSQTTSFVSVLDYEVTVGPRLEFFVVLRIVLVANFLVCSVEVLHVFFVDITGGDISTTSEPPNSAIGLKVTVVEVHGWAVGVLRMHNTTQSAGEERNTFTGSHALGTVDSAFGSGLKRLLGHASVNNTKIDSSLFKNISSGHDTGHTATSVGTRPSILPK